MFENVKTSRYFDLRVRRDRPEVKDEYVQRVTMQPVQREQQGNGFFRMWGFIEEEQKYLRVITWEDGVTVENAFFDSNYTRKERR